MNLATRTVSVKRWGAKAHCGEFMRQEVRTADRLQTTISSSSTKKKDRNGTVADRRDNEKCLSR